MSSTARADTTAPPADAPGRVRYLPWLAAMAVAYALTHHTGVGMAWLGTTAGDTRWADWIDLVTPYAVLFTAAAALHAGGAGRRAWVLYLLGAFTYVEGHGIHLAANSVGNSAPSDIAHLWDEYVGHYLWYGGSTIVFAALAVALARRPPARSRLSHLPAVLIGITFTTNSLEGRFAPAAIAICVVFTAWGWAARGGLGRVLISAFAPALVMLVGYGLWFGGFPEPTDLGWI